MGQCRKQRGNQHVLNQSRLERCLKSHDDYAGNDDDQEQIGNLTRAFFTQQPKSGGQESNANQEEDDKDLLYNDQRALQYHAIFLFSLPG